MQTLLRTRLRPLCPGRVSEAGRPRAAGRRWPRRRCSLTQPLPVVPVRLLGMGGGRQADGTVRTLVSRGGIYWLHLDKRRPCVVVSPSDVLTVDVWQAHVVPLTSNVDRAGLAGNVLLDPAVTGLPRASVAVPLGLELVDRAWLGE